MLARGSAIAVFPGGPNLDLFGLVIGYWLINDQGVGSLDRVSLQL